MADLHIAKGFSLPVEFATKATAILAQRRKGKRLSLDTRLPTPIGWTTIGEVRVGDRLFNEAGAVCRVTHVFPIEMGDSYRVVFSDGSCILADAEHLWQTHTHADRKARRSPSVVTTAQIRDSLLHNGERNHYVQVAEALDLPDVELPLHPYVLGLWLGDGTRGTGYITTADQEIVDNVRACGYDVRECRSQRLNHSPGTGVYLIVGIRAALAKLGVLREKFVPPVYLRAGTAQRQALLEGLMDSDGSIGGGQPQAEFSVTSERLFDGFYEVLVSLGHKATRSKRPAKLNGVEHGVSYRAQFTPTSQVFRLPRKAQRLYQGPVHRHLTHRSIVAVDPVESVPMRCIAVDSPSHLFLAGESMIPTHNSYTADVIAEECVAVDIPFVILDPTGAHWGLRSSADGEKPGLPVVILGGQHGDLPLERGAGRFVADLVLDSPGYYVLDLSLFESKAAEREFVTDFAERLYRRKGQCGMDFVLLVIVDEADMFIPQRHGEGDNKMVGAFEAIVRRGGIRGLGVVMISQRAAVLNKNVLEMIDILIALRTVGPNDRSALDGYIVTYATAEERAVVMGSLASLGIGEAWIYEPGESLLQRVQIRERRTFNSGATPKTGERRIEPKRLADVDLAAIKEAMAATIERAKADDPAELRKRIRDLERQLKDRPTAAPERIEVPVEVEVPVFSEELVLRLERALEPAAGALGEVQERLAWATTARGESIEFRRVLADRERRPAPRAPSPAPTERRAPTTAPRTSDRDVKLGKGERKVLEVLAEYPDGRTYNELAFLAGYSAKASTLGVVLSKLRKGGLVEPGNSPVRPTAEGLAAVGGARERPTGQALLDQWLRHPRMGEGERRVLLALIDAYPEAPSHDELCETTGYSPGASTIGVILSKLRKLGLVEKGARRVAPEFMDAIA